MTAGKCSLFRPTILAAISVIAPTTCTHNFLRAQDPASLPTLRATECPAKPLKITVGSVPFEVNCALLDPNARWYEERKEAMDQTFVSVVALYNLGVFADNLLDGKPVNVSDLVEIESKIDKLCRNIACEGFKSRTSDLNRMSTEEISRLIVILVTDGSIRAGAESHGIDLRYCTAVKTARIACLILIHRLHSNETTLH